MRTLTHLLKYHALSVTFLLSACTQTTVEPVAVLPDLVGDVVLNQAIQPPNEDLLLDIGVLIFTTRNEQQHSYEIGDWVFDEIIQKETQFLPSLLKNTLTTSNQWGAVRVIPEHDPSLDLFIHGEILQSNGKSLQLQIRATDSSNREWINKIYTDQSLAEDYPESTRFTLDGTFDAANFADPFQDIYEQIANDLVTVRSSLESQALIDLNLVTDMRYASDLSPDTFTDTLQEGKNGLLSIDSLPALNDPMLARVADMKHRHYLFIDTVDEYYQTLYDDVQPAYVLWRRYSAEQISELETSREERNPSGHGNSNNFLSLSQRYDRYKWSKIFKNEFNDLAVGFNNELAPAILELNSQVHSLTGTMEQQYRQWRGILRQLFELENNTSGKK
jgi:hypothetical protein